MKDIKISLAFKTQTKKAVLSIAFFILIYLLMLALAIGLMMLCVYGAIMLMAFEPMDITIGLGIGLVSFGIGLASLGLLVVFFLLKFLFKSHKIDRSHLTELTQAEAPLLFNMIDDIVETVGTNFPKKVYISSDVNASVFYDSNFWSMFFPIRKNLHIGLGLVNAVTQSELKAILSHEFGHFSQKTMKVGSYVYHVNQVIFNLLYDDESYDTIMQRSSNESGFFSFFLIIGAELIERIKGVLRTVYAIVNKHYMALSREMEFHADEIAAHVTGYVPLKNSLLRLSLADHSFQAVLSFYEDKIAENKTSDNIFKEHLYVTNFLAKNNNIDIVNNLPQVVENELHKFNKSKLVVKDQWASHPSTEDRIAMLEKTGLLYEHLDDKPANLLFADIEKTQKALTQKLFKEVVYSGESSALSFEEFQAAYKAYFLKNSFSNVYNGYYDSKNPLFFDLDKIELGEVNKGVSDLFSASMVDDVYTAISLEGDIASIKQISDDKNDVTTFDYDGVKYAKKDCNKLIATLEQELALLQEKIRGNDIDIFNYFYSVEQKANMRPSLAEHYRAFFDYDKEFDVKYQVYSQLSDDLHFLNITTPIAQVYANFSKVAPLEEQLKKGISELLDRELYQTELTKEMRENFELYVSKKWVYFENDKYVDKNLEVLYMAMNNYVFLLSRGYFLTKQKLLHYQEALLNDKVE